MHARESAHMQDDCDGIHSRLSWYTHMSWTNNSAVPVAHHDIVRVLETVRARAVSDTLLALLELLEQAEVARD